jgi:3-phosphoglycerate kinase
VLLENVRFHEGEEKNDDEFAEEVRDTILFLSLSAQRNCHIYWLV